MGRAWVIGVMLLTGFAGLPARAADGKKAKVEAHKTKAFALLEKGDYAGGIAEMEKAYALIPHPGFLLNIAVAYDRWPGHCPESLETFERFFLECNNCKLLAGAKKKHADVEGTCRVEVSIRSTPEGARVAVDGAVRGKTPFTTRLLPGSYAIVVDLSGHERATETLSIARGKPRQIELALQPRIEPPPPPPPPIGSVIVPLTARASATGPNSARAEPIERTGPSVFTWVAFGVGGAGLIVGGTFTGLAMRDVDREEKARMTPLPKAEIEAIQREAKRDAIIAHVGYGAGVAGVAAGVILLLVTGGEEKELAAVPAIGPGSIGLAGSF